MDLKLPLSYKKALEKIQKAGYEVYLVGGCVRDFLLGLPIKDYDFVTTATPDQGKILFPEALSVGESFGVLKIPLGKGEVLDLATARKEGPYSDSRHPDYISYSSIREDLQRRDFTINSLLYDPIKEEIVDLVGGRDDLEKGLIRAVGNPSDRFQEDPLRIWRGVRFQVKLGFEMEVSTKQAMRSLSDRAQTPSKERITEELKQSLKINSLKTLSLLEEYGLDKLFFNKPKELPVQDLSLEESLVYLSLDEDPEVFSRNKLVLSSLERENLKRYRKHFDKIISLDSMSLKEKNELRYSSGFTESLLSYNKIFKKNVELDYETKLTEEKVNKLKPTAKEMMELGFKGKEISSNLKKIEEALFSELFTSEIEKIEWIKENIK